MTTNETSNTASTADTSGIASSVDNAATTPAPTPGARAPWRLRLRTLAIVVAVIVVGQVAAHWQLTAAGGMSRGVVIGGWFGEWLVYGMALYAILHFSRKTAPATAAVAVAVFIAAGVNVQAFIAAGKDRAAHASLTRAMPLYTRIQSGETVGEQEVISANVGVLEPLLLAQAANAREMTALDTAYLQATEALQLEQLLAPASLASPGGRAQSRARLAQWQQATAGYKSRFAEVVARGRQRIESAQAQMPASMGESGTRSYDQSAAQASAHIDTQVAGNQEIGQVISAILDLLDANPSHYTLLQGPPPQLEFRNPATLQAHNALLRELQAAARRVDQAAASQAQGQAAQAEQLTDLLKR